MKKELVKNEVLEKVINQKMEEMNNVIRLWYSEKSEAEERLKNNQRAEHEKAEAILSTLKNMKNYDPETAEYKKESTTRKTLKDELEKLHDDDFDLYKQRDFLTICIKSACAQKGKLLDVLLNNIVALNADFFKTTPAHYKKFKDAMQENYPEYYIRKEYSALKIYCLNRCNSDPSEYLYIYNSLYDETPDAEAIDRLEVIQEVSILSKIEIENIVHEMLEDMRKLSEKEQQLQKEKATIKNKYINESGLYLEDVRDTLGIRSNYR